MLKVHYFYQAVNGKIKMSTKPLRLSITLIILSALSFFLNGCTLLKWVVPQEFSEKNKESVKQVWLYINDTTGHYRYSFDKMGLLRDLTVVDSNEDSKKHYSIDYNRNGQLQSISESRNSFYGPQKSGWSDATRQLYFDQLNGKLFIASRIDYYPNHCFRYTDYYDNGIVKAVKNYCNDLSEGEMNDYYRNGVLKTHELSNKGKVITIVEYKEDGTRVEETNVQNGNGRWLRCDDKGGFCCDCMVVNGNVNCKFLKSKKHSTRK
ncbi:MAG: hypothetical protein JWO06_2135 [Bacteroidota bacterium]|nr:hypothetical protein [Bacteroidota bacterium]